MKQLPAISKPAVAIRSWKRCLAAVIRYEPWKRHRKEAQLHKIVTMESDLSTENKTTTGNTCKKPADLF